jgi:hypothetical protein
LEKQPAKDFSKPAASVTKRKRWNFTHVGFDIDGVRWPMIGYARCQNKSHEAIGGAEA